ncbi:MAG: mandelate racemase/muconate lactonizing enzyme family protein [Deltaproteobacteria bacterium]|nr:mandelate racemase/muconate lactonizing enzyme family protein [Deltaproteobacteria bacterium]
MRVERLEILPVSIPYKTPTKSARGGTRIGHHVIVRLFTDEGIVGVGESSTLGVTGEAQQRKIVAEIEKYIAQFVLGEDPFDIEKIMSRFQRDALGTEGRVTVTALASVGDAMYDIMGKKAGVSVSKLVGGRVRDKIPVGRSLSIKAPEEVAEDAIRLKGMGYKLLTVKIGVDPEMDIKRVAAVRKAVGDGFPIEVDANQGYNPAVAIRTIRKMEEYDILNVEQPCPGWDLDGLAEIARALDTPVIADESVTSPAAVLEIIKRRAADIICLKPARDGGIFFSKKMTAAAELADVGISLGSAHPFGIGAAALHHFVASTPWASTPIGYGRPEERVVDDIITEPIPMENGEVTVLDKPGLGVELDEAKVKKYAAGPAVVLSK